MPHSARWTSPLSAPYCWVAEQRRRYGGQILADMLSIPLRTVENADSSLGSAMLAGVAVGAFASHQQATERCVRIQAEILPDPQGASFYESHFSLYKQIQAALAPVYHQL